VRIVVKEKDYLHSCWADETTLRQHLTPAVAAKRDGWVRTLQTAQNALQEAIDQKDQAAVSQLLNEQQAAKQSVWQGLNDLYTQYDPGQAMLLQVMILCVAMACTLKLRHMCSAAWAAVKCPNA
jgi:hypothetical protein